MTIHSLTAHYNHPDASAAYPNCYSYTDEKHNVIGEPFVREATDTIICAMASAGMCLSHSPQQTITLDFTNNTVSRKSFSKDDLVIELTYDSYSEDDFNMYHAEVISPEIAVLNSFIADDFSESPLVPLCNHLMDYFLAPPATLWVRIKL